MTEETPILVDHSGQFVEQLQPVVQDTNDVLFSMDYDTGKKILDEIYDIINIFYSSENLSKNVLPDISREPTEFIEEIRYLLRDYDLM